jgi:hypothetical protein
MKYSNTTNTPTVFSFVGSFFTLQGEKRTYKKHIEIKKVARVDDLKEE